MISYTKTGIMESEKKPKQDDQTPKETQQVYAARVQSEANGEEACCSPEEEGRWRDREI